MKISGVLISLIGRGRKHSLRTPPYRCTTLITKHRLWENGRRYLSWDAKWVRQSKTEHGGCSPTKLCRSISPARMWSKFQVNLPIPKATPQDRYWPRQNIPSEHPEAIPSDRRSSPLVLNLTHSWYLRMGVKPLDHSSFRGLLIAGYYQHHL